jgi:hypothetical protein
MKSVLMSSALSAVIAICVTPGFGRLTKSSAPSHPAMLAQEGGPVALPGSADAPEPNAADDENDQAGQAANNGQPPDDNGQPPDDPDAVQPPPMNAQPAPADDNGDDTSAEQQQPGNNEEGGAPIAPPTYGNDNND